MARRERDKVAKRDRKKNLSEDLGERSETLVKSSRVQERDFKIMMTKRFKCHYDRSGSREM